MTSFRFALPLVLVASLFVAAEPAPPADAEIAEQIRNLEAEDPEARESAEKQLALAGEAAAGALRKAMQTEGAFTAEGIARARRLLANIDRAARRRALFPVDPVGKVRAALGGEESHWNVIEVRDSRIEDRFTNCRLYIADWVGPEDRPIASILAVAVAEPLSVFLVSGVNAMDKLVPYVGKPRTAEEIAEVTEVLGGLAALMSRFDGPFEFAAVHAQTVPDGQGGTLGICDWLTVRLGKDGLAVESRWAEKVRRIRIKGDK